MKKRVIKLTESDIEKLVQRIIKEEDGDMNQQDSSQQDSSEEGDNPQDVKNFLDAMKKYFLDKYPRFAGKINTRKEKILLLAALGQELDVDLTQAQAAKSELKKLMEK